MEYLLQKFKRKSGDDGASSTLVKKIKGSANKNAMKDIKKINIGGFHRGMLVRKKGGGTRGIEVPDECNKADLIERGLALFFPYGKVIKEQIEAKKLKNVTIYAKDFNFDVWHFQYHPFNDGRLIREAGFVNIHLYIFILLCQYSKTVKIG